jgi:hypothetical protein
MWHVCWVADEGKWERSIETESCHSLLVFTTCIENKRQSATVSCAIMIITLKQRGERKEREGKMSLRMQAVKSSDREQERNINNGNKIIAH